MILLARRSVHRLGWLARRLDWVSAAVAGTAARDRSAAPVDELARAAVTAAMQTGSRRGVTATLAPMTDAPPLLPCGRLWRHVYEELLVNALRHARGVVELHVAVDGAVARVAVVDDGPGIPPERADAPFAARSDGGLGLWLAHGLAIAAGGDLRLEPCNTGARVVAVCPLS